MTCSPEIEKFVRDCHFMFRPNSPRARSLFAAIRRTLVQYKLEGCYTPEDIISEAHLRTLRRISNSDNPPIQNPRAWIRKVSIHIIQEYSRKQKKQPIFQGFDNIENIPAESQVSDETIDENIETVVQAFQSLELEDRAVLSLRCLEGLSWREVAQRLEDQGCGKQTEGSLRKRGERAMKRLRKTFHSIRSPLS